MFPVDGRYADGRQARLQPVTVAPEGEALTLRGANGLIAAWPCSDIRLVGETEEMLTLALAGDSLARLRLPVRVREDLVRLCPALRGGSASDGRTRRFLVYWGLGAIAGLALTVFVLLPWAAGVLAGLVPAETEQRIGRRITEAAIGRVGTGDGKVCSTPEAEVALQRLIDTLTQAQPPRLPLEIRIINSPVVNAFALPGGQLLIMRGLLDFVPSETELAAVLAHEIAHVDARHNLAGAIRAGATGLLLGIVFGDAIGGVGAVSAASYLLNASYSREVETEADRNAALRLQRAGINPAVANSFFLRLTEKGFEIPALLSTHPPSPDRTRIFADSGQPPRRLLDEAAWRQLRMVCGHSK